jgi:hypothetical protein
MAGACRGSHRPARSATVHRLRRLRVRRRRERTQEAVPGMMRDDRELLPAHRRDFGRGAGRVLLPLAERLALLAERVAEPSR